MQFQLEWEELSTLLVESIEKRNELLHCYQDCPEVIDLVENKFNGYYNELQNHWMIQKNRAQASPRYKRMRIGEKKIHSLYRYLEMFPFKNELLYHSRKSSDNLYRLRVHPVRFIRK
jgi:hypothetical protein